MMYVTPEGIIKVAVSKSLESIKFEYADFTSFLISSSEDSDCKDPTPGDMISNPHSNSFLDLNGDCIPDIFLQKSRRIKDGNKTIIEPYYEVYT